MTKCSSIYTILDEPAPFIGAVAEVKIFSSLEQHMEGKTVILITHWFCNVKRRHDAGAGTWSYH